MSAATVHVLGPTPLIASCLLTAFDVTAVLTAAADALRLEYELRSTTENYLTATK